MAIITTFFFWGGGGHSLQNFAWFKVLTFNRKTNILSRAQIIVHVCHTYTSKGNFASAFVHAAICMLFIYAYVVIGHLPFVDIIDSAISFNLFIIKKILYVICPLEKSTYIVALLKHP